MEWKEKLSFAIKQNRIKRADIFVQDGRKIFGYTRNTPDDLCNSVIHDVEKWGGGVYRFLLRTSESQTHENGIDITLTCSTDQKENKRDENQYFSGNIMTTEIAEKIKIEVKRELELTERERRILEKEEDLKEERKRYETAGGKLGIVLEHSILPHINKLIVPTKARMNSNSLPITPLLEKKETEDKTATEAKYKEAIVLLTKNIDAETLLQFAKYVEKEPGVIQKLKLLM